MCRSFIRICPAIFLYKHTFAFTISRIISSNSQLHEFWIIARIMGYITILYFISSLIIPSFSTAITHNSCAHTFGNNISISIFRTLLKQTSHNSAILSRNNTFTTKTCLFYTICLTRHLHLIIITYCFRTRSKLYTRI